MGSGLTLCGRGEVGGRVGFWLGEEILKGVWELVGVVCHHFIACNLISGPALLSMKYLEVVLSVEKV